MAVTIYNNENYSSGTKKGKSTIKIAKSICMISQEACRKMGINPTNTVSFIQNDDNPEEWYLVFDIPNGYPLKKHKSTNAMAFHCAKMAAEILECYSIENTGHSFTIDTDGCQLEGISNTCYAITA